MRAMEAAKGWGATLVVVAHQPGILRPMNKVLLLVGGQARYFGPRDQLIGHLRSVDGKAPAQAPAQAPAVRSNVAPFGARA